MGANRNTRGASFKALAATYSRLGAKAIKQKATDYAVIWTLGNIIGPPCFLLKASGVIQVKHPERLHHALARGPVIIAANHPSLIETVLIPGLGWPKVLFDRRYFFWNMPDLHLFPVYLKWLHPLTRAIQVDRLELEGKQNRRAFKKAIRVLNNGEAIVIHPEGGRTFKFDQRGVSLHTHYGRQVADVGDGAILLAAQAGAWILPLYIEMSQDQQQKLNYRAGLKGLLRCKRGTITLHFEQPYQVNKPIDRPAERKRLVDALLHRTNPSLNN